MSDPLVNLVHERVVNLTGVPKPNAEFFQVPARGIAVAVAVTAAAAAAAAAPAAPAAPATTMTQCTATCSAHAHAPHIHCRCCGTSPASSTRLHTNHGYTYDRCCGTSPASSTRYITIRTRRRMVRQNALCPQPAHAVTHLPQPTRSPTYPKGVPTGAALPSGP